MRKSCRTTKPPLAWSDEEMRQRGVRAVVAAMRLSKQHRELSLEHACYVEEARILTEYLKELRSLNNAVRELLKHRNEHRASRTKLRNPWLANGASHSLNHKSSKDT